MHFCPKDWKLDGFCLLQSNPNPRYPKNSLFQAKRTHLYASRMQHLFGTVHTSIFKIAKKPGVLKTWQASTELKSQIQIRIVMHITDFALSVLSQFCNVATCLQNPAESCSCRSSYTSTDLSRDTTAKVRSIYLLMATVLWTFPPKSTKVEIYMEPVCSQDQILLSKSIFAGARSSYQRKS